MMLATIKNKTPFGQILKRSEEQFLEIEILLHQKCQRLN